MIMVDLEDVFKKCSKSRPENMDSYDDSSEENQVYRALDKACPRNPEPRHGFRYVPLNSKNIAKILEEIASKRESRKKVLEDIAMADRLRRGPRYLN